MKGVKILFLFVFLCFSFFNVSSLTEIAGCSVLSTPGEYYLLNTSVTDHSSTYCMQITADDIVLDLGGMIIDGDGSISATYGVYLSSRNNITVKNGTISQFRNGVYLSGSTDSFVENLALNQNRLYAIRLSFSDNNSIINVSTSQNDVEASASAISVRGSDYNNLENVLFSSELIGLSLVEGSSHNIFDNMTTTSFNDYAVYFDGSSGTLMNNTLINSNLDNNIGGVWGDYGLYLDYSDNSTFDNITLYNSNGHGVYILNSNYTTINNSNFTVSGSSKYSFYSRYSSYFTVGNFRLNSTSSYPLYLLDGLYGDFYSGECYATSSYGMYLNNFDSSNFTDIYSIGTAGVYSSNSANNIYDNLTAVGFSNIGFWLGSGNSYTLINNSLGNSSSSSGFQIQSSNVDIINTEGISYGSGNGIFVSGGSSTNLTNFTGIASSGNAIRFITSSNSKVIDSRGVSSTGSAFYLRTSDNVLVDNINLTSSGNALHIYDSEYNNFTDCTNLDGLMDVYFEPGFSSKSNMFINCTYDSENVTSGSVNNLLRVWYSKIYVKDNSENPLGSVNITFFDVDLNEQYSGITNSSGYTDLILLKDYNNTNGVVEFYSPYNITATTSDGYSTSLTYNVTEEENNLSIILVVDTTPPATSSPSEVIEEEPSSGSSPSASSNVVGTSGTTSSGEVTLSYGSKLEFSSDGVDYDVYLRNVDRTVGTATFDIVGDGDVILSVGESQELDVDGDGIVDVVVTLNAIDPDRVAVDMELSLIEDVSEVVVEDEVVIGDEEEVAPEETGAVGTFFNDIKNWIGGGTPGAVSPGGSASVDLGFDNVNDVIGQEITVNYEIVDMNDEILNSGIEVIYADSDFTGEIEIVIPEDLDEGNYTIKVEALAANGVKGFRRQALVVEEEPKLPIGPLVVIGILIVLIVVVLHNISRRGERDSFIAE